MGPKQFKREKRSFLDPFGRFKFKQFDSLFGDGQSSHPPSIAESSKSSATSLCEDTISPEASVSTTSILVSPGTIHVEHPALPGNQFKQAERKALDPQTGSTQDRHLNRDSHIVPAVVAATLVLASPTPREDIDAIINEFKRVKAESDKGGKTLLAREEVVKFLRSLEAYASVLDVAIQHSPAITALVWADARFLLKVALSHTEYMEIFVSVMATIIEKMAVSNYYATIYADFQSDSNLAMQDLQKRFESAMPDLYDAIKEFVNQTKEYFDHSKPGKSKISDVFTAFSVAVQPLLDVISEKERVLREGVEMIAMGILKANSNNHKRLNRMQIVLNEIKMDIGPMRKFHEALRVETKPRAIGFNNNASVGNQAGSTIEIETQFQIFNSTRQPQELEDTMLSKLPRARDAAFNSALWQHEPLCLGGTRVGLMQEISDWSTGSTPDSASIYWLCGMAGTGKSTISRTLSQELYKQKRLAASFFFSKGHAELSHAKYLFTTIAYQLSNVLPPIRPHISKAITDNPDIFHRGLRDQWEHLICYPLSILQNEYAFRKREPHILLIDALDECDSERDVKLMLELISKLQTRDVVLRVFITSRPELPIQLGFQNMAEESYQRCVLHDIEASIVREDISRFFHDRFKTIRHQRRGKLSENWPADGDIKLLCHEADKLFIYAATVCRFIEHPIFNPRDRLRQLLDDKAKTYQQSTIPTGELDAMYLGILNVSLLGESNKPYATEISSLFKTIVGAIVLLFDVLPCGALARLLGLAEETVGGLLDTLGSVISVSGNDSIRLLHPSFRDFLTDGTRCPDPHFLINQPKTHTNIFLNCLNLMSKSLQRDICSLGRPCMLRDEIADSAVREHISTDIEYACLHWAHHLKECQNNIFEIGINASDRILEFFQTRFLHWVEALSLIRKTSEGVLALGMFHDIMTTCSDKFKKDHPELLLFVNDAKRFFLKNKPEIDKAPLQVYCAALLFSPTSSIVRTQYRAEAPSWVKIITKGHVAENWDPLIHVSEVHSNEVESVAFSPDGKLLASASFDGTVRLWDPFTEECQSTLNDSNGVCSIAFSADGKLLASASLDSTVRLWDPFTGASQSTLTGHSNVVNSVAFSPDGKLLASASDDRTIRLWDPSTEACQNTLTGHSGYVSSVAFSPDGKLLASASWDSTVRLWDPFTGACQSTLTGHSSRVFSVAFSPDGKLLASASYDETVRLWDPFTRSCQSTVTGHSSLVSSVAFSPDGKLLASASYDRTVKLWHVLKARQLQSHNTSKTDSEVNFSVDGSYPFTGACQITLNGHSDRVSSVAFSPDAKLLASASYDRTVRLWDPFTGACQSTFDGHSDLVNSVTFAPDANLLASASDDRTVKLWDPLTGACQSTLTGHTYVATSVAFSPDGKLLASASWDGTVRLWDPFTGTFQRTFNGHSNCVTSLAFSQDGKLLASASHDRTVRLWDPFTGACQSTLTGHSDYVRSVAFSPDGKQVASASDDRTVRLWGSFTGACQSPLTGHCGGVFSVAFSPDGKLLASSSWDRTIRLWDVRNVKLLQSHDTSNTASQLNFSIDGSYLLTDQGTFAVSLDLQGSQPRTGCSPSFMSTDTDCILWGGERLLLLPVDMRPTRQAIRDNRIAMGYASGRVTILALDVASLPSFT